MADFAGQVRGSPTPGPFSARGRRPYRAGASSPTGDLAATLRIAAEAACGLLTREDGDLIEADMKVNDGLITKGDLKRYEVKWREPSIGGLPGYKIVSMCPLQRGHCGRDLTVVWRTPT